MKILGIGVDIVESVRIEGSIARLGESFLLRVFTESEREYCAKMHRPAVHYAARFAAKEAVSKAFGTGICQGVGWREIEIRRKASGEPFVVLHGGAADRAQSHGIAEVLLSLSHSEHYAVAQAIAIGAP